MARVEWSVTRRLSSLASAKRGWQEADRV